MLNPNASSIKQIAIVGGGISGLATAYALQEKARTANLPVAITLFESASRLGGKIVSEQEQGFLIEGGPDSFLAQKPWAAQLAQALGLEGELMGANPEHKKLYVVQRGRLTPMPDGVLLIVPTRFMPFVTSSLISWPGKLRMGMDLFIPGRKDDADESLASFIRRRLGREALEKIAEPLLSGIHVSDPEMQSILGTFPRFRNLEKQHGSLIRGMLAQRRAARSNGKSAPAAGEPAWKSSVFVTLRGGMQQLVQALESALPEGSLHRGARVTALTALPEGGYLVSASNGERLRADAVVLATPAGVSGELLTPLAPELARSLRAIRYVSTATVSLAYRQSEIKKPLDGVGFIIPCGENRRITACTVTSTKFTHRAPQGHVLVRCFVGGPGKEEAAEEADQQIVADARAEMQALLGIRAEPVFARVHRWVKGNAQYDVGHLERVKRLHALCAETPGLFLTGSAYEGIGVPDCVHQGQQAAEKVFAFLQERQPREAELAVLAAGR